MATLVLSAVGSAVAGPFGSAIGGLIGRQIDQSVFGGGNIEGPRLTELAVTTSSYGQAIPRRFGRMRVAGTIIWATDLVESSETTGGKGQPSRTSYSYSVSFAVAVSSTPISRIGRVWADGELLVGASGDLKVGGVFRTHLGNGNDPSDPLIEAEQDGVAPAFRDCAYVVFEDLQLEEFGNRIPAMTFEVFTSPDQDVSLAEIVPDNRSIQSDVNLNHTKGFADEGGPISSSLKAIDRVYPLTALSGVDGVSIIASDTLPVSLPILPEQLAPDDTAQSSDRIRVRNAPVTREPLALRYYDEERDYQPGVQRALGRRAGGSEVMIDLPATLTAQGAKELVNSKANRTRWLQEQITWRTAELNPDVLPGSVVKLPDHLGSWRIASWEWYERGVEYTLQRMAPQIGNAVGASSGIALTARDVELTPTILSIVEVPLQDTTMTSRQSIYAVATSESSAWRGASLFVEQGNALTPIGSTNTRRATSGKLMASLSGSQSALLHPNASIRVELPSVDLTFESTDIDGLGAGANRILVGAELMQFLRAEPLGNDQWQLTGLLRGRGGTEDIALEGHPMGTSVTLLNDGLTALDPLVVQPSGSTRIAAIGVADAEPVFAQIQNAGLSLRPPSPVHPRASIVGNESLVCYWARRARGAWQWQSGVETPLVEEAESYLIGYGAVGSPHLTWTTTACTFSLSSTERNQLIADHGSAPLWVKQIGTHAASPALLLTTLM